MNSKEDTLKKDIMKIPVFAPDKILVWLVYRDKKPATEIWIDSVKFPRIERILGIERWKIRKVEKFLKKAGLKYMVVTQDINKKRSFGKYGDKQKYNWVGFIISKSQTKLDKLFEILSSDEEGEDIHNQLGDLYGFPQKAVRAFSKTIDDNKKFDSAMSNHYTTKHEYKNKYWFPYTSYKVRIGHEIEDSRLGREWADTIRKDLPELANEFEQGAKEFWEEMENVQIYLD